MGKKNKKKEEEPIPVKIRTPLRVSKEITALIEKKLGNEEYLKFNYKQAIDHYTCGLAACGKNPSLLVLLLINRATSFLRLKEFHSAVEDSTYALAVDDNVRARICRAFGFFFEQEYSRAFKDYELASALQPSNLPLQLALQLANDGLTAQLKKIKDVAASAKSGKKVKDTALEWIGDFGLLGIDEEPLPQVPKKTRKQPPPPKKSQVEERATSPPPLVPIGDWMYGVEYARDVPPAQHNELAVQEKMLGNTAFRQQHYLKAVGHYSNAVRYHCIDGVYFSNRAMAYIKLGRWKEAITDCSTSLAHSPSVKAYLRRGTARAAIGAYWLAVGDYKNALEFEPANRDCIKGMDMALTALDSQNRAGLAVNPAHEGLLAEATKLNIEFKSLATLRANADQLNSAAKKTPVPPSSPLSDFTLVSKFTNALMTDGRDVVALTGRADAYFRMGDVDKAVADYRYALRLDPDNLQLFSKYKTAKSRGG